MGKRFQGLVPNIHATTILKAFILNALRNSLIATFCVSINAETAKLSPTYNSKYDQNQNSWQSIIFTFVSTFFAAMIIYTILFIIKKAVSGTAFILLIFKSSLSSIHFFN